MILLWVLALVVAVVLGALGYFVWRMSRPAKVDFAPEWVAEFSPARYKPIERLLDEDDIQFLSTIPGVGERVVSRLRAERRSIFRSYLRQMSKDFGRLQAIGKLMVLYSPQDRPDLAQALLRQEYRFRMALATVHVQLLMHTIGIGTVDVRRLVAPIQSITGYVQAPQMQMVA